MINGHNRTNCIEEKFRPRLISPFSQSGQRVNSKLGELNFTLKGLCNKTEERVKSRLGQSFSGRCRVKIRLGKCKAVYSIFIILIARRAKLHQKCGELHQLLVSRSCLTFMHIVITTTGQDIGRLNTSRRGNENRWSRNRRGNASRRQRRLRCLRM